ncbi:MAG: hypothetical protein ACFFD4_05280 [Candidatus Odinarchaeota archaeon]
MNQTRRGLLASLTSLALTRGMPLKIPTIRSASVEDQFPRGLVIPCSSVAGHRKTAILCNRGSLETLHW